MRDRQTVASHRDIDTRLGLLRGEGASLEKGQASPLLARVEDTTVTPSDTYYDLPVLKAPVWKPYVGAYFYVGGVVGACATLAGAAQIAGGGALRPLVRRARWIAAIGSAVSAALLIKDLGRPLRFLDMLRVVRPTSPMNVGTWVVSAIGGASALSLLPGGAGDAAGIGAALVGLPMSGYTAVLLANTAIPTWNGAPRALPALFVSSAIASGAAVLELLPSSAREERCVKAFAIAGKSAELAASVALERTLAKEHPRIVRPLRHGLSGVLFRAAQVLGAASLLATALPGRSRKKSLFAGITGTAGALALRFAILEAGKASARDPRATFEPQREKIDELGA